MLNAELLRKNLLKNLVNSNGKRQKLFIVSAAAATLIASGGQPSVTNNVTNYTTNSGDVDGEATTGNDALILGSKNGEAGTVATGAGDDSVTGGVGEDLIWAGEGVDTVVGGAGVDRLFVLGITASAGVTEADLQSVLGSNVDLSGLLDLDTINNHSVSDLQPGDSLDGEADGAFLYLVGALDFAGVDLANISQIFMAGEVVFSVGQIEALIASGLTEITGSGSVSVASGQLDLDGLTLSPEITILDADGNEILPTPTTESLSDMVNVAENSTAVGAFKVTDASTVGNVSYSLDGVDKDLFVIDATSGEISFVDAPDFELARDEGEDNTYNISVIATDQHSSSSHAIAVKGYGY